jgi:hypothetical protein
MPWPLNFPVDPEAVISTASPKRINGERQMHTGPFTRKRSA